MIKLKLMCTLIIASAFSLNAVFDELEQKGMRFAQLSMQLNIGLLPAARMSDNEVRAIAFNPGNISGLTREQFEGAQRELIALRNDPQLVDKIEYLRSDQALQEMLTIIMSQSRQR